MDTEENRRDPSPKKKAGIKKKIQIRWIVFGALLIYGIVMLIVQQNTLAAVRDENRELSARQEELMNEKEELAEKEKYVESDTYIEDVARDQLGMVKEGETVFYPAEETAEVTPSPEPEK